MSPIHYYVNLQYKNKIKPKFLKLTYPEILTLNNPKSEGWEEGIDKDWKNF
jgi:hypothetical protein